MTNTPKESKRRWSPEEKLAIVEETYSSGMSVSSVARIYGVHPNQLSGWRKAARLGQLETRASGESIELSNARRRIRELERLLGAKTLEVELLRAAAEGSCEPPRVVAEPKETPARSRPPVVSWGPDQAQPVRPPEAGGKGSVMPRDAQKTSARLPRKSAQARDLDLLRWTSMDPCV